MLTLAFPEQLYIKLVCASYGWPLLAALAGAFAGFGLSTWLQLGPMLIDAGTLSGALLAGGFMMRLIRKSTNTGAILNSLRTTVYFLSDTPNMCSRSQSDSSEYLKKECD